MPGAETFLILLGSYLTPGVADSCGAFLGRGQIEATDIGVLHLIRQQLVIMINHD